MIPSAVFVRQLCAMARNQSVLQLADLCEVIRNTTEAMFMSTFRF